MDEATSTRSALLGVSCFKIEGRKKSPLYVSTTTDYYRRLIDGKLEQAILAEARRLVKEKVRMEDYQAYDLFQIQGLSAREVAISLAISPTTVRVRAFRVRGTVEREMRRIVKQLENCNRRRAS